ncbi:MAG: DUF1559 domain-containing protein [Pirellulales bacterium]|nr:DUF1559 domain-containing protein [Pirellulales bacterium]
MKRLTPLFFLPLLLFAMTCVFAEENFDPAARAKTIAPFIDEASYAVVHIDFTRVKADPLVEEIKRLIPNAFGMEDIANVKAGMQKGLDMLSKNGVKDLYAIIRQNKLDVPSLLVMPIAPSADEKSILAMFPNNKTAKRIGNVLLVLLANRSEIDLSNIKPDPRPALTAAFEAAGDTAVQIVFTPPKHFKRVIEETMPQLPKEIGGGESKILTQGCLWAALGIDLPPQLSIKLVIQSQDADAARRLQAKWIEATKFAAQLPKTKELFPNLAEVSKNLTPETADNRLVLTLDDREGKIGKIIACAQPTIDIQRENALRTQSMNNLKMIGLAMHNYHNANKHFPPAAIYSKEGKPLLSWRVMVLPWLEQKELYKQFHLDEPWDSPNNIKLIDKMPRIYRSPMSKLKEPGRTNYLVPVGPGTVFEGKEGMRIRDIKDGTSKTIMAVEVDDDHAVVWTKPDDLVYDPKEPAKGLGGHYTDVFLAVICDGSVRAFPLSFPAEDLRAWFTAAGREMAKNP